LQVNSRWKPLAEIYKIYTLSHRSAFKISSKIRQTFSHSNSSIFKISLIFPKRCLKFTNFNEISPEFQQFFYGNRSKACFVRSRYAEEEKEALLCVCDLLNLIYG